MFFYEKYLQQGDINPYSYADQSVNRKRTISLDCRYFVIRASDIRRSKEFYIYKLGLTLLEEQPGFLASQAGQVRFFILGGYHAVSETHEKNTGTTIMFMTDNIHRTRDEIVAKGLSLVSDITTSFSTLKYFSIKDPDGNIVTIAQYPESDSNEKNKDKAA